MRMTVTFMSLALASSCGGKPVGGKVPKANPAHVAGGAAAAAALITLADPKAARLNQENRGGEREAKSKKVKETVPEDVLLRSEDADSEKKPCEPPDATSASEANRTTDLFPVTGDESVPPPKCEEEEEEDGESKKKSAAESK